MLPQQNTLEDLDNAMDDLSLEELKQAIRLILPDYPTATRTMIKHCNELKLAKEDKRRNSPAINFDYLFYPSWRDLVVGSSNPLTELSEIIHNVCLHHEATILKIQEGCAGSARWETQWSGLDTLRRIATSILAYDDPELVKGLISNGSTAPRLFADAMGQIMWDMTGGWDREDSDRVLKDKALMEGLRSLDHVYKRHGIRVFSVVAGLSKMRGC